MMMDAAIYKVNLTASEAVLLDGKVSKEAQAVVDSAKLAMSLQGPDSLMDSHRKLIADLVEFAKIEGVLIRRKSLTTRCPTCGLSKGYETHRRSGKYHRKGQPNYDRPVWIPCIDYKPTMVQGYVKHGCCEDCASIVEPLLKLALADVVAQLPDALAGNKRYRKYDNVKCTACNWEGHKGEMIKCRTLMGDGWYPAQCPKCKAKNELFATLVKTAKGFTCVELTEEPTNV